MAAAFFVGKDSGTHFGNCDLSRASLLGIFHIFTCNWTSLYMFKECNSILKLQMTTPAERFSKFFMATEILSNEIII